MNAFIDEFRCRENFDEREREREREREDKTLLIILFLLHYQYNFKDSKDLRNFLLQ